MTGMRPILIVPSSLAVGAAIAASMMEQAKSECEKLGTTLVIEPYDTDPYVPEVLPPPPMSMLMASARVCLEASCDDLPFMRKQSGWERSHPNQPWYTQFKKRRGRKKNRR